jgi:hypothetical protein
LDLVEIKEKATFCDFGLGLVEPICDFLSQRGCDISVCDRTTFHRLPENAKEDELALPSSGAKPDVFGLFWF